jgi:hypothetical protein
MTTVKLPLLPDFTLPDLPQITFPTLPAVDFSSLDLAKLPAAAKDVGYVTVGLAVLTFQKAQVRRQELKKTFSAVDTKVKAVGEQLLGHLPSR